MSVVQRPKPLVSTIISLSWARTRMLGMKFGTPIPTMVRVCYHPAAGHWLEFLDGDDADAVAQAYPDEIRQARLEMMQLAERRDHITATFRRQTVYPTPLLVVEPTTSTVAPVARANPVRELPVAKPVTVRVSKAAIPVALPVAQPVAIMPTGSIPTLSPTDATDSKRVTEMPPIARPVGSDSFTITEQTKLRIAHLVAASRTPPSDPPLSNPAR